MKAAAMTIEGTPVTDMADETSPVQRCYEACCESFHRYFVVRTRDDHLVDDLMQQLWLRARLGEPNLRGGNPEPWLWSIARNLLREAARRTGRRALEGPRVNADLAYQLAEQFDTVDLPDAALQRQETKDQLLLGLTALRDEPQSLLVNFYFAGRSLADLAALHDTTPRAIEGRLYRARAALRDQLIRQGEGEDHVI